MIKIRNCEMIFIKNKRKNIMPSRNIRPGFISKFPPILQAVSNWWKTEKNHYFHRKFRKGNKKYLAHFGSKNHKFSIVLNLQVIGMSVWYAEIFTKGRMVLTMIYMYNISTVQYPRRNIKRFEKTEEVIFWLTIIKS